MATKTTAPLSIAFLVIAAAPIRMVAGGEVRADNSSRDAICDAIAGATMATAYWTPGTLYSLVAVDSTGRVVASLPGEVGFEDAEADLDEFVAQVHDALEEAR